jgi:hypothetical protein
VEYDQLKAFIEKSMRMSYTYQPVMLLCLLEQGGRLYGMEALEGGGQGKGCRNETGCSVRV